MIDELGAILRSEEPKGYEADAALKEGSEAYDAQVA